MWLSPAGEDLPLATTVGSPNMGARSLFRDLEAQLTIVTHNEHVRKQLRMEYERFAMLSRQVSKEDLSKGVQAGLGAQLAARLLRHWF